MKGGVRVRQPGKPKKWIAGTAKAFLKRTSELREQERRPWKVAGVFGLQATASNRPFWGNKRPQGPFWGSQKMEPWAQFQARMWSL